MNDRGAHGGSLTNSGAEHLGAFGPRASGLGPRGGRRNSAWCPRALARRGARREGRAALLSEQHHGGSKSNSSSIETLRRPIPEARGPRPTYLTTCSDLTTEKRLPLGKRRLGAHQNLRCGGPSGAMRGAEQRHFRLARCAPALLAVAGVA